MIVRAARRVLAGRAVAYHRGTPMSDALIRQWTLLRLVPRAPVKIDTTQLRALLRDDHGIETTPRTVQRDLLKLQEPDEATRLGIQ